MEIKDKKEQVLFGRLLRVVFDITLESTKSFNPSEFFKIKKQGGIFAHIDNNLFDYYPDEIKDSVSVVLARYEFTKDINEEDILNDGRVGDIYTEVDLAHVKQICYRHIVLGEKILLENGKENLFWTRNKKGQLCQVYVNLYDDGWRVHTCPFRASYVWFFGYGTFFLN